MKEARWRALVAVVGLTALLLMAPAPSAATTGPNLPPPNTGCSYDGCMFGPPEGVVHDGVRFQASSVSGAFGSYGWWEHFSEQPPGSYWKVQLCNDVERNGLPFEEHECGPWSDVYQVPTRPSTPRDIIYEVFGPSGGSAVRVASCESGLNPRAVSPGGGNHGLFQINNVHRGTFERVTGEPWASVYDSRANTRFAKWLYDQQGWGPWACQP